MENMKILYDNITFIVLIENCFHTKYQRIRSFHIVYTNSDLHSRGLKSIITKIYNTKNIQFTIFLLCKLILKTHIYG